MQFKLEDEICFCWYAKECLHQLPFNALDEDILSAEGATLKLDNHKNGRKGVCFIKIKTEMRI